MTAPAGTAPFCRAPLWQPQLVPAQLIPAPFQEVLVLTRSGLGADLSALGLAVREVVMVHASLRAIGAVAGDPDEVHLAI